MREEGGGRQDGSALLRCRDARGWQVSRERALLLRYHGDAIGRISPSYERTSDRAREKRVLPRDGRRLCCAAAMRGAGSEPRERCSSALRCYDDALEPAVCFSQKESDLSRGEVLLASPWRCLLVSYVF